MKIWEINSEKELWDVITNVENRGFFRVPDEFYFTDNHQLISRSNLIKYLKCPAQLLLDDDKKGSQVLLFGRAFHCRLLEPDSFNERFVVTPKIDRRTKTGKAAYKEFQDSLNGRDIIDETSIQTIDNMIENVRYDADISDMIYSGDIHCELAAFAEMEGVLCKCKIDVWDNTNGSIVEFKTTSEDSPANFQRSFFRYNYDIQAAFYYDIISKSTDVEVNDFHVVGVQKDPPYQVFKFTVGESVFRMGRARYLDLLRRHVDCVTNDFFPSAMPDFEVLEAPNYLLNKYVSDWSN